MPRPYTRLRETTFDLYVERDLLPGYFKTITVFSSWIVLAGYVLFAITFTTPKNNLNASRNLITAIASGLLIVGYIGVLVVATLSKSLLFTIDGILTPILSSSLLGFFVTIANYGLHVTPPISQVYMSIPLVTACVTTVISAIALALAYRELIKIRRRDERRRWHLQMGPYPGNHDTHAVIGVHGQDDEAQRRQLMRLLHDRRESISASGDNNTFKIDLPGGPKPDLPRDRSMERGSSPDRGFSLGNLIPWKNNKNGTFKDARERRREEIERSSIHHTREGWRTPDPNQYTGPYAGAQPPAWGWPPATRYA